MNSIQVKLNDLPELPFEKILGYLSLQERIKCRAVSRRWHKTIDSFRVRGLCFSDRPSGLIYEKSRYISGPFEQNFVNSTRFDLFYRTFRYSILTKLKHFRLCDLCLDADHATLFAKMCYSFSRLEELDLIRFDYRYNGRGPYPRLKLNMPMLNSILLEEVFGIDRLTLNAPKLKNVQTFGCSPFLNLVRVGSVERLIIGWTFGTADEDDESYFKVKNLKNLKFLFIDYSDEFDSTFLSAFEQLKEIHLFDHEYVLRLFEQKQRYGRHDLKIVYRGCLLNSSHDPLIDTLSADSVKKEDLRYLAEHPLRLADQIPFLTSLSYDAIECIPRGSETTILNRFINLNCIDVHSPVQDIERFLSILKSLDNIVQLEITCDQPQEFFNRLPDHCANLQKLNIRSKLSDIRFLYRLRHLIKLIFPFEIETEFIREVFEELKFLSMFEFKYITKGVLIEVEHNPKLFRVFSEREYTEVSDLDSAIRFIVEKQKSSQRRRNCPIL